MYGTNSKWMEDYLPLIRDIKLRDLIMPGSHDSGTYSTKGIGKELAITQDISIKEQLEIGCRYLDLRYAGKGSGAKDVYIYHSIWPSIKFDDALLEIACFLKESPKEFITIKVQQEGHGANAQQKEYMINLFQQYFGKKMLTGKDEWWDSQTSTLGQVVDKKKNLFVCADKNLIDREGLTAETEGNDPIPIYAELLRKSSAIGIWDRDLEFVDSWYNTDEIPELYEKARANMIKVKMVSKKNSANFPKFHISQMILSAQSSAASIWKYIYEFDLPDPREMTEELHKDKELSLFMRDHMDKFKVNILLLDFVSWNPSLLKYLIGTNIKEELIINKCWMGAVDFTEEANKLVTRENCLFVPDPMIEFCHGKQEMELLCKNERKNLCNKTFYVAYKYGEDGPLICKCFPLTYNLPLLITYDVVDQKLHNDAGILVQAKLKS